MRLLSMLPLSLTLVACAATPREIERQAAADADDQTKLARQLAGLTPGTPQNCIRLRDAPGSTRIGSTILYRASRGLIYRNDTNGGCSGSGFYTAMRTSTPSTQLCRGDIVVIFDPVSRIDGPSCALGDFIPYRQK